MDHRLSDLLARWREDTLSPDEQADLLALVQGSDKARQLAAEDRLLDRLLFELHRPALNADQVLRALTDRPGSLATRTLAAVEARTSLWRRVLAIPAICRDAVRRRCAPAGGVRRAVAPWPRLAYLGAAVVAVLAAAWFLLGPSLARPVVIGELAAVVGQPTLHRGDSQSPRVPRPPTPIHLGDRLETGDADKAELVFLDGTTLRLGFNTAVEIGSPKSEIRSPKTAVVRPGEIRLLRGQVWTQVQKTTNATPYAIRTDVATAVARGTEFGVRLQRPSATDPKSEIRNPKSEVPLLAILTVKEGAVDFSNAFGTVQATAMTESTATANAAPTEPRRLETLQTVQLNSGAAWSLLTAPLDWPEAARKLVGGGGSVDWELRTLPGTNGRPEVRVSRLPSSSPAARAGLRLGDVIAALDGQPVTNAHQVAGTILFRPGAAVNLRVRRAAGEESFAVAVAAATNLLRGPELPATSTAPMAALLRTWLNASADPASDTAAESRRFEQAAALSRSGPVRAAAFNQLGVAFELEDALGPAVRAYGRAVYLDPDAPLYRFNLALALRKIGSFERALEEFAAAARLEPESVPARLRVAEVTSLLGRHAEALALAEALVQAAPQDHSVWELKTQLLLKLQRPADAIPPGRLAAELDPDCPVAHAYLAEALHAAGRLDDALAAWTEALDRAPFEAAFILNRGTVLRDLGQSDAAERSFRQALELRPDFALAHFNLGNALADRGEYAAAAAAFERARELDPAYAAAHWRSGDMALKLRQFPMAERAFRDALDVAPDSAEAWYGLGETHRLQRRSTEAERAYRRAIELKPNYAAPQTALGIVFYDRGDADEAERLYRRAIELDPAEAAPYHNLGTLHREARGDLAAAERWFREALRLSPDSPDSVAGLGLVALSRGDLVEAEKLLRRAWEAAPDVSANNNNLGEVLRERGRLDEAEPLYRKALELDPDNPAPYGNLGIIHAQRKQYAEAERMFRALIEREQTAPPPARLPALVNLAMVCGEQGKLDEAERLYRQALGLAPGHPRVANGLAAFLADHERKLDEALTLAEGAVRAQPDNPSFLDTLGWVQAQRGDLDAAERTLQRALDRAGQEPPADEIRKHLERVRERKTRKP
ncbi:MAG: tetratricopeptide repeat protein [Verrucomicrobia bacterium]|nr:tetratricopeptide repeat protein [Verrucomicrobiota bacterium]